MPSDLVGRGNSTDSDVVFFLPQPVFCEAVFGFRVPKARFTIGFLRFPGRFCGPPLVTMDLISSCHLVQVLKTLFH